MIEDLIIPILISVATYFFLKSPKVEAFVPSQQSIHVINNLKKHLRVMFNPNLKFQGILSVLNHRRNLLDEIVINEGNKSFTNNKREIFICLKDQKNSYYDYNSLLYVTLHEIAHVLCYEIGHTTKFSKIFNALLQYSSSLGFYDFTKPFVENYCPTK
jgi:hypothetical protein